MAGNASVAELGPQQIYMSVCFSASDCAQSQLSPSDCCEVLRHL